jgi:hypothetical protein
MEGDQSGSNPNGIEGQQVAFLTIRGAKQGIRICMEIRQGAGVCGMVLWVNYG